MKMTGWKGSGTVGEHQKLRPRMANVLEGEFKLAVAAAASQSG